LFKCHWFDIDNGVRVDRVHGLVEVKHNSSFKKYDSFVLAWQVTSQVYYLPYISLRRGLRDWWVAMKTKPRSNFYVSSSNQISSTPINAHNDIFQEDNTTCPFTVRNNPPFNVDGLFASVNESVAVNNQDLEDGSDDEDYDEYGRSKRQRVDTENVDDNDDEEFT
jgi:hypothetical protein